MELCNKVIVIYYIKKIYMEILIGNGWIARGGQGKILRYFLIVVTEQGGH